MGGWRFFSPRHFALAGLLGCLFAGVGTQHGASRALRERSATEHSTVGFNKLFGKF